MTKKKPSIGSIYKVPPINARTPNLTPGGGVESDKKIGRNAPCPCGSGKKYKRCCSVAKVLPVVRQCGPCTACCTAMGVPTLEKPAGEPCENACEGGGCSIYKSRPSECSSYRCEWIKGRFTEDQRPDNLGIVIDDGADPEFRKRWGKDAVVIRELYKNASYEMLSADLIDTIYDTGALIYIYPFDGGNRVILCSDKEKQERVMELARQQKEAK